MAMRALDVAVLALVLLCAATPPAAAQAAGEPVAAQRPKIGLVLSGGGARGLAHVGVLKVLDELRIPVDYVAATSMGAIVGGLYAAGVGAPEMEKRLATLDWAAMFSDSPPRGDLDIRRKDENARYPIALEMGYRDGALRLSKGALGGGNLELFLHELVRAADGAQTFDQLPTPFRAVATDMVTGEEKVFDRGPLYQALRASMSVPGLFAPLEIDGHVYGDGGLVDNLPVALVKKMGADVVIAVNIGTPLMTREQLSSLIGYTAQSINILTKQNVRASLALLTPRDVLISPQLGTLTFLDFAAAAKLIELGEAAARDVAPELSAYALTPAEYSTFLVERRSLPKDPDRTIATVRVEGTVRASPEVLAAQLESKAGAPFDPAKVDTDVSGLHATGDFERVTYHLIDEKGQRDLVFDVTEKSWGPNFLRFGLNLSSDLQGDTFFNLLIGHKTTWLNSLGAQWVNEIEFGEIRRFATEFYQPFERTQTFFGSIYGQVLREPQFIYDGDVRIAEYDVLTREAGVDVGMNLGRWGEVRVGPRYAYYRGEPQIGVRDFLRAELDEVGIGVQYRYDQLDDPFFPRRGFGLYSELFRGLPSWGSETDVTRVNLKFLGALPVGPNGALQVGGEFGSTNRRDTTFATDFQLGGFLNLSGLRTDQLNGDYLGFVRVVYQHRMGKVPVIGRSWFLGGSLEAGNAWLLRDDVSFGDTYKSGSAFLGADTFLGPFYFAYGRTNRGDSSWYIFLGRP
jgi:NTE family protein